jgi:hypothetical protein
MSAAHFGDPALIYHHRKRVTPSAHADQASSTSVARFTDPNLIYHYRERATPVPPDTLSSRTEAPVYQPIAINRNSGHVHPMVTRCTAGVLSPVDWLILAADKIATSPNAYSVLSFVCASLANPTSIVLWRRSTRPCWPTTLGT